MAFCKRFNVKAMPDELNSEHELIVVASSLDESTERIVGYLAGYHEININAVLFRLFKDSDREYLTRAWLRDPVRFQATLSATHRPAHGTVSTTQTFRGNTASGRKRRSMVSFPPEARCTTPADLICCRRAIEFGSIFPALAT